MKYALTHTPVVITDVVEHTCMTAQPWTFQYIQQVYMYLDFFCQRIPSPKQNI